MEKRTQRYTSDTVEKPIRKTRLGKNQYLYDEINNKIGYDDIVNLDTQTRIDLSQLSSNKATREQYQVVKDYQNLIDKVEEEKIEETEEEPRIYDINSVLEEAKKNRIKYDELERKRKLRENNYVTLANPDEKVEQPKKENDIDEEELTNLINTITSHNLLSEIKKASKEEDNNDDDILSDLVATNVDLNLEDGIAKEYTTDSDEDIDKSFYTQSMDLSEQDFEFSEELERERKTKIKIAIVVSIIIVIIGVVLFLVLKKKGIL